MNAKVFFALVATVAVLVTVVALHSTSRRSNVEIARADRTFQDSHDSTAVPTSAVPENPTRAISVLPPLPGEAAIQSDPVTATNKLARLSQIREKFQALAAGAPAAALQAAKQISDETERETALLTLVTQWTQGELRPPRERARAIEQYGLEAGLGMELASNPELAMTWANELTEGPARQSLLRQTAISLTGSDPTAAFALSEQLPEDQRRPFVDAVFAGWADKDTEAALQWADQLPDGDRDAAIRAIRSAAPVGIGTALGVRDGYPVVQQLLPGTPAEQSGQIHPGDRILALAQGDNSFVDAHNIPLSDLVQMIRGAPGTPVQLQILPANAAPGSSPQTISIMRDQLKFKH